MATEIVPLFPLSVVLLPAMPLPLHIFEERYKEMMGDIIPSGGEFGITLTKDDGIVNIGCTATVVEVVRKYPDGRLDVIVAGQRRFRIEALDEEKSYLRARVEFFDDEDVSEVPADLRQKALAVCRELAPVDEEAIEKVTRLSFHIAQFISDLDKRQTVLALRSETERLQYLVKIVPQYVIQQQRIEIAKRLAPQNGHAKHIVPGS